MSHHHHKTHDHNLDAELDEADKQERKEQLAAQITALACEIPAAAIRKGIQNTVTPMIFGILYIF